MSLNNIPKTNSKMNSNIVQNSQLSTFLAYSVLFAFFASGGYILSLAENFGTLISQFQDYLNYPQVLESRNQEIQSLKTEILELKKSQREALKQLEETELALEKVSENLKTSNNNSINFEIIINIAIAFAVIVTGYNYGLPEISTILSNSQEKEAQILNGLYMQAKCLLSVLIRINRGEVAPLENVTNEEIEWLKAALKATLKLLKTILPLE